jgi:hypothetical protein
VRGLEPFFAATIYSVQKLWLFPELGQSLFFQNSSEIRKFESPNTKKYTISSGVLKVTDRWLRECCREPGVPDRI